MGQGSILKAVPVKDSAPPGVLGLGLPLSSAHDNAANLPLWKANRPRSATGIQSRVSSVSMITETGKMGIWVQAEGMACSKVLGQVRQRVLRPSTTTH